LVRFRRGFRVGIRHDADGCPIGEGGRADDDDAFTRSDRDGGIDGPRDLDPVTGFEAEFDLNLLDGRTVFRKAVEVPTAPLGDQRRASDHQSIG